MVPLKLVPRFQQIEANLWLTRGDAVLFTSNGQVSYKTDPPLAIMGTGTAEQAKKLFPGIDEKLARYLIRYKENRPFKLGWYPIYGDGEGAQVVNLPTKNEVYKKTDLDLVRRSCVLLMQMADKFHWNTIVLPRPGCGAGGLSWSEVLASGALDVLDQRCIVVSLPPDREALERQSREHEASVAILRRAYAAAADSYVRCLTIALRNGEVNADRLAMWRAEFQKSWRNFERELENSDAFVMNLRQVYDQSEPEEMVTF